MGKSIQKFVFPSLIFLLVSGCSFSDIENISDEKTTDENEVVNELSVAKGFDFKTQHQVKVTINDNSEYALYEVYVYNDDPTYIGEETFQNQSGQVVTEPVYKNEVLENLLFSGIPKNGVLSQTINLPTYCQKVFIRRKANLNYSSAILDVSEGEVNYTFKNNKINGRVSATKNGVNVYLYAVNGSGQLFQIDPLNGQLTDLSAMPMGSYTCAIDQESKTLYSIGRSSPYPLMKYSIESNEWQTVAEIGIGGPRLDYNVNDGLLYFSSVDKLYTINPISGLIVESWNIKGLHSTDGGDLAFAEDGTLFLCTFSGLYRLELDQNNEYQSVRISADNLPFQPTSMTFDSNQELWLANNASSSDLIIMDTQTGGWQYRYGITAANDTDLGRTINDLTTFRVFSDTVDLSDSDGDGVLDTDDSYPNNPEIAFEHFTPSKYGTGTIAFEDFWPSYGDYDFNDVALNYQVVALVNSDNLCIQLDIKCQVKAEDGAFIKGIGIEIESLSPSEVQSVTGTKLYFDQAGYNNSGYYKIYPDDPWITISKNSNGTEAGQGKAVVIITDNARLFSKEGNKKISIRFNQPISTSRLGVAPFNPFIIVGMQRREWEVHLPYKQPTSLGKKSNQITPRVYEGRPDPNQDVLGNYVDSNGLPWAIDIPHNFKVPKSKVKVYHAYNYFKQWAASGGVEFADWYKDNPGYRNANMLDK